MNKKEKTVELNYNGHKLTISGNEEVFAYLSNILYTAADYYRSIEMPVTAEGILSHWEALAYAFPDPEASINEYYR